VINTQLLIQFCVILCRLIIVFVSDRRDLISIKMSRQSSDHCINCYTYTALYCISNRAGKKPRSF